MWIECEDEVSIHKIYNQAYKMKNSDIRTINYFPGEIYSRMKELESFCKLKKESNPNFKYQIRLGYDDLVLKIKEGLNIGRTRI